MSSQHSGSWHYPLVDAARRVYERVVEHLPAVFGALLLLLIGWLVALLLRAVFRRLTDFGLAQLRRVSPFRSLSTEGTAYQSVPAIASGVVFWLVMLFFGAAAVELLGVGALAGLLSNTARYLPRLLVATFSILAGVLVGDLVYTRVRRSAPQMGAGLSYMLARAAQGVIISLAGIIAIDQLGLDSNVLVLVVGICAGSVFGAASLAFGLGARTSVSNIIAVHYLSRSYRVGDTVRIGDVQGTISAITRTAVVLDAPEGRVEIPASRFSEETSVLVTQEKG